jgi:hypothetical protein
MPDTNTEPFYKLRVTHIKRVHHNAGPGWVVTRHTCSEAGVERTHHVVRPF